MKIVLVEGAPGVGTGAEAELRAAGHTVVGCDAVDPSAPCRGLEVGSEHLGEALKLPTQHAHLRDRLEKVLEPIE